MAQQNFIWLDGEDMTISAKASTAIVAGDIVYAAGGTGEPFGTTVPSGVDYTDIPVLKVAAGTATQGALTIGVALGDAASGSQVTIATEGIFLSPAEGGTNVTAGDLLRPAYNETTAGVAIIAQTSTAIKTYKAHAQIIGRAITGAATEGHYVMWKLRV